jgi:hypothetical protein
MNDHTCHNYHLYNLAQLKQICREKKLTNYSRLKRFELIQLLEQSHTRINSINSIYIEHFPKIITDIHYIFFPELTRRTIDTRFTKKLRHNLGQFSQIKWSYYLGDNIFVLSDQKRIFIQTQYTPYQVDINSIDYILNINIHNADCILETKKPNYSVQWIPSVVKLGNNNLLNYVKNKPV